MIIQITKQVTCRLHSFDISLFTKLLVNDNYRSFERVYREQFNCALIRTSSYRSLTNE